MDELQICRQRLMDCPVIAAVKNEQDLAAALESECEVVFYLFGTIPVSYTHLTLPTT